MLLALLSLALTGTADPAPRCLSAPAGAWQVPVAPGWPVGFTPAAVLRQSDSSRSSRRRSRDYLDPDDDSDEEGGAGARKVEPLSGLLPTPHQLAGPLGPTAEAPALTSRPAHTPLIYALCTLLL